MIGVIYFVVDGGGRGPRSRDSRSKLTGQDRRNGQKRNAAGHGLARGRGGVW